MPDTSTTTADNDVALARSRALRRDRQRRYRASLRAQQASGHVVGVRSASTPAAPLYDCNGFFPRSFFPTPMPAPMLPYTIPPIFWATPRYCPSPSALHNVIGAASIAPPIRLSAEMLPCTAGVPASLPYAANATSASTLTEGATNSCSAPSLPLAAASLHGADATVPYQHSPPSSPPPPTCLQSELPAVSAAATSEHTTCPEHIDKCSTDASADPTCSEKKLVVREFGSYKAYEPFHSRVRQRYFDGGHGGGQERAPLDLGVRVLSRSTNSVFLFVGFLEGEAVAVCGATLVYREQIEQRTCDIEVFMVDPAVHTLGVHNLLLSALLQRIVSAKLRLGRGITQLNKNVKAWSQYGFPVDSHGKLSKGGICTTADVSNWCSTFAERYPLACEVVLLPPDHALPELVQTPFDLKALGLRQRVKVFKNSSPEGGAVA